MFPKSFVFKTTTENKIGLSKVKVSNRDLYTEEMGYGFVIEKNREENPNLGVYELNSGFNVPFWYRGLGITQLKEDEKGCFIESDKICAAYHAEEGRLVPICFKADVEREGNFEVTVHLYAKGEVLIFAGPRRLVYKGFVSSMDEKPAKLECTFVLNVCDIIPRGTIGIAERRSIDIAVVGREVHLSSVKFRQINCPTLYIGGDSTVTDQSADYPYAPETSYCGWGQMLSAYLPKDVAVSNHAHSGLTTESFKSEGHYAIVQSHIKPGDYFFIQFAHNDQKLEMLKAEEGYRQRVVQYILDARQQGAYPVIVTPLCRNSWKANDEGYNDLLEEYASVCLKIGEEYQVPVIDLHGKSMELILENGMTGSRKFYFPKDYTHTNDCGGYLMAGFVATEMKSKLAEFGTAYARLANLVGEGFGEWQPQVEIPVAPVAPAEYVGTVKTEEDTQSKVKESRETDRENDFVTRAESLDFVIKAARLFATNVFNDRFEDVIGHEWYAGAVECAVQNNLIPEEMIVDNRFFPEDIISLEDFVTILIRGYRCRNEIKAGEPCKLDRIAKPYSKEALRIAVSKNILSGTEDISLPVTRKCAAEMCKKLDI